jgi:hypothetical protein
MVGKKSLLGNYLSKWENRHENIGEGQVDPNKERNIPFLVPSILFDSDILESIGISLFRPFKEGLTLYAPWPERQYYMRR